MIPTLIVKDRRRDFALEKKDVCLVGGKKVNYQNQSFQITALGSGGNLSLTIPESLALIRQSYLKFSCVVNLTGTTTYQGATTLLQYGLFGLNSNALYKIINNIQFTLGSYSQSWSNINTTIDLITSVRRSCYVDATYYGAAAVVRDNARDYDALALTNKNVLGAWYTQSLSTDNVNTRLSRISISQSALSSGAGSAAVTVDIVEPFIIGPLSSNNDPRPAFVRPGAITFIVNTVSDTLQLFSCSNTGTATLAVASVTNVALDWVYGTIDVSSEITSIPPQVYPSFKWDYNLQTYTLNTAQGMNTININQVVFSSQPELIIVACRPQFASRTVFQSNKYFPIVGCNLNYNLSNVLNIQGSINSNGTTSAQTALLYQICQRNGLDMDFDCWTARNISSGLAPSATVGSSTAINLAGGFLVLNPALDLMSGDMPSMSSGTTALGSTLNFSGTLSVYNPDNTTPTVDLVILRFVPQEYMDQGGGSYIQCNLTPSDQGTVVKDVMFDYNTVNASDITGAGFFGDLMKNAAIHAAKQGAKMAANHIIDNPGDAFRAAKGLFGNSGSGMHHRRGHHGKLMHHRGGRMVDDEDIEDVIDRNSSSMHDKFAL